MYKLKTVTEKIGTMSLSLEILNDLNETIDDLFSTKKADAFLEDLCPYFGTIWPAARALATHMSRLNQSLAGAKILEVGCGLALPSLVAAKLGAEIVATDFHPDVPRFLEKNLELNQILNFKYENLNWREPAAIDLLLKQNGPFDWVMGSDVLYESAHPRDLARALSILAGKKGRIIIADPARPYLQSFLDAMGVLGYRYDLTIQTVADTPAPKEVFLVILNRKFGGEYAP